MTDSQPNSRAAYSFVPLLRYAQQAPLPVVLAVSSARDSVSQMPGLPSVGPPPVTPAPLLCFTARSTQRCATLVMCSLFFFNPHPRKFFPIAF